MKTNWETDSLVLTNEEITQHNLSVVTINPDLARQAFRDIYNMVTRRERLDTPDTYDTSSHPIGVMEITTGDSLVINYVGYEHFDIEVTFDRITTRPIDLGNRRYVVSGTMVKADLLEGLAELGLGETTIWLNTARLNADITRNNTGRKSLRKQYVEEQSRPSLRISTTNAEFRKILNKCKGGAFCIASRNNRVGIYNSESDPQVVTTLSGASGTLNDVAGVDYKVIYEMLYRRKQNSLGIMNRLSRFGEFDITEYGILDGRVYVVVSGEGFSLRLLFCAKSELDAEVEIPEATKKTRTRRKQTVPQPEAPVIQEFEPSEDFTEEEATRINRWLIAHTQWVTSRNQRPSTSRQVWFSHYSMMLIQQGNTPDELDFQIMSKV